MKKEKWTIEHKLSRWNKLMSEKPYHKMPTQDEIFLLRHSPKVNMNGKPVLKRENDTLILSGNFIHAIATADSGLSANRYEDLYEIKRDF